MDQPDDEGFDLIDLNGVSIADVMQLEPTVLAHSLHRILEEVDHPQDAVAGWQSAL
jgi:FXSXX-COOH protein